MQRSKYRVLAIRYFVCILCGFLVAIVSAWAPVVLDTYRTKPDVLLIRGSNGQTITQLLVHQTLFSTMIWDQKHSVLEDLKPIRESREVSPATIWNWSRLRRGCDLPRLVVEEARGWPLRCLSWSRSTNAPYPSDQGKLFRAGYRWAIVIGDDMRRLDNTWNNGFAGHTVYPLRPRVWGLVINTSFYAILIHLLWSACVSVRRRLRVHNEQCRDCGYSLRGLGLRARCPECGCQPTAS